MSLGALIGGIGGFLLGGPAGAAQGASIGGGIDRNETQRDIAAEANAFSAHQYATRYQTQVKDLQAAGLNPMLAYTQSPGSAPMGQQYQAVNPFERSATDYSSAANVERTGQQIEADTAVKRAEMWLKKAQEELTTASADQSRATTHKLEAEAKKISEEIKNIPLEGDRLIAAAKQLREAANLSIFQQATERDRAKQMQWLAVKTMVEGDLLSLDKDAILKAENFGKEFGQYKPLIDSLVSIFRMLSRR